MSDVLPFMWITVGVVLAVLWPVLRGLITREFPPTAAARVPPWVRRYSLLAVFSAMTALILLAIFRSAQPDIVITWYVALLLGFAWESSIEKFANKPQVN